MLAEILAHLRCPLCRQELTEPRGSLRCPRGHSFDQAKQGYVQLTAGPVNHPGDSTEMVTARADFLAAGHYSFISDALTRAAPERGLALDVGAGTGYHLGRLLDARPELVGLAVDVSKPALRRAARAHPRSGAVLADAWRGLPLADHGVAVLLNVFAPRNGPEFARVLAPDGALLVVTPTARHLAELVDALALLRVDPDKEERVAASLAPWFVEASSELAGWELALSHAEVATLVGMGPSAWHLAPDVLAGQIARLPEPCRVTAEIRVSRYSQVSPEILDQGRPQGPVRGAPAIGPGRAWQRTPPSQTDR
jgi:23S rRNA (guanine745-N1)-methyltransferase